MSSIALPSPHILALAWKLDARLRQIADSSGNGAVVVHYRRGEVKWSVTIDEGEAIQVDLRSERPSTTR